LATIFDGWMDVSDERTVVFDSSETFGSIQFLYYPHYVFKKRRMAVFQSPIEVLTFNLFTASALEVLKIAGCLFLTAGWPF